MSGESKYQSKFVNPHGGSIKVCVYMCGEMRCWLAFQELAVGLCMYSNYGYICPGW